MPGTLQGSAGIHRHLLAGVTGSLIGATRAQIHLLDAAP
jgi:hypothetical protein